MQNCKEEIEEMNFCGVDYKSTILENRNIYFTIFQILPIPINIFNSKYEIIRCNKNSYQKFGCKNEEEYIAKFLDLSPTYQQDGMLSQEKILRYMTEASEGSVKKFDWMYCNIDGENMPAIITLMKLDHLDEFGGNMMLGFHQDMDLIVEKKKEQRFNYKMKAILDATPLCLNLWNSNFENVMCNKKAVELFELDNEQQYLDRFIEFSPEFQPNGVRSSEMVPKKLREAFETGFCKFKWLHCKVNGDEMPCEITLAKITVADDLGQELIAGFTRDLREQLAGHEDAGDSEFEEYFLNQISHKILFETVATLSDEMVFALDIRSSIIQYFGAKSNSFGINNKKFQFPESIFENNNIFHEDKYLFEKLLTNIETGICEPIDIRIKYGGNNVRYTRIVYNLIFNRNNEQVFAVGKIIDIHEKKDLEMKASTDLLTNCFNKITSENEIIKILQLSRKTQKHSFFIIDIDDFKAVNDNLGHHFGDIVLSEVANNLKEIFTVEDVVGRIGGDEFIVFMQDSEEEIVIEKAEKITEAFRNTYSGEYEDYKISGSIGIVNYPDDGISFQELYKAADKALYQSKIKGKDCYTFYSEELLDGTMKNRTKLGNASRLANAYFDAELISLIFDLLYETKDIKASINETLKLLTRRLNVDRAYIFETFDDGNTYGNTYEWCKQNIGPEIDNLQQLPKAILMDFFNGADENGIIYSNDLSVLKSDRTYKLMLDQGIKSFIHAQIKSKGFIKEFLGFDDCTKERVWSEKEINSILYATKIISTFLNIESEQRKQLQKVKIVD